MIEKKMKLSEMRQLITGGFRVVVLMAACVFAANAWAVTPAEFDTLGTAGSVADWQGVAVTPGNANQQDADATTSIIWSDGASSWTHNNWTFTGNAAAGVSNEASNTITVPAANGFFSNTTNASTDNYFWIQDTSGGVQGSLSITVEFPNAGAGMINYDFAHRRGDLVNFDGLAEFDVLFNGSVIDTQNSSLVTNNQFHNRTPSFTVPSPGSYVIMFRIKDNPAAGEHAILLDNMTLTGAAVPVELQSFQVE